MLDPFTEFLDEASAWSPETFADRFELVIEGENLLSYERIHDVLGTWPRSVWSVTEETERYPAWRQNPFVSVPKGGSVSRTPTTGRDRAEPE